MPTQTPRADHLVIDGLIIANWGRPVFEAMQRGGLAAANCTCSVWGAQSAHRSHSSQSNR